MDKSLFERCHISTNKVDDSFVGIKTDASEIFISFPMGYRIESNDDLNIRESILSLLSVLSSTSPKNQGDGLARNMDKENIKFPLQSYLFIILDYLQNGYYYEKERYYTTDSLGKINWKKTVKQLIPRYDGNNPIYLEYVIKKSRINETALITRIHEFCVYDSFLKLGWLYTPILPPKPKIKFNKNVFISVLSTELSRTFNDTKKQLFTAMLNITRTMPENSPFVRDYSYGTYSFEHCWETMIDAVFGIKNKASYFPRTTYLLENGKTAINSALIPDTIMVLENKVYILDAKYYKYGITGNPSDLPQSSSIQKQITYGEYLEHPKSAVPTKRDKPYDGIYNSFILPYNRGENSANYSIAGIANADWKGNKKTYENVVVILADTKHIMDNYLQRRQMEIVKLSMLIEQRLEKQKG